MAYPTPPPTNSPKHNSSFNTQSYQAYNPQSQRYPTQETATSHSQTYQRPDQQPYDASTQPLEARDPNSFQTYQHSYNVPPSVPAQESYFHSYSAPTSPSHEPLPYNKHNSLPPQSQSETHRRRSSPAPSPFTKPSAKSYSPLIRPTSPPRRDRSPGNPNYYTSSPLPFLSSPKPTPYNLNRPKPRPGLLKRIGNIVQRWIRAFMRWSKRNPKTAGFLTFFPVVTIAAVAKVIKVLGKGVGLVEKRPKPERSESNRGVPGEAKRNVRWVEYEDEGESNWGLEKFVGFGGTKGGPVEGVLKIMQMLVNHYSKLTPSPVPRAASILFELYFLEAK